MNNFEAKLQEPPGVILPSPSSPPPFAPSLPAGIPKVRTPRPPRSPGSPLARLSPSSVGRIDTVARREEVSEKTAEIFQSIFRLLEWLPGRRAVRARRLIAAELFRDGYRLHLRLSPADNAGPEVLDLRLPTSPGWTGLFTFGSRANDKSALSAVPIEIMEKSLSSFGPDQREMGT
ncbi:hypothetical protein KM043_013157 [Ampulex compressa]|nr:hypothetical protein KM043_013157 [Ampulex compressa]